MLYSRFLLFINSIYNSACSVASVVSVSFWLHRPYPTRLLCPWDFSWQEYWRGLPWSAPGDLPDPGNKPPCPALQRILYHEPWGKPIYSSVYILIPVSQFSLLPPPLVTISLFSTSGTLLLFCRQVCLYSVVVVVVFKIPHTSNIIYLSFSVWLISVGMTIPRSIHVTANGPLLSLTTFS